jgi:hypothetical protein
MMGECLLAVGEAAHAPTDWVAGCSGSGDGNGQAMADVQDGQDLLHAQYRTCKEVRYRLTYMGVKNGKTGNGM